MDKYQTFDYDVIIVGAGGAGLRAAIEASTQGAKTALVCKSLLGKAHTVMAEGGVIKSDAVRHPLEPLPPDIRRGLLELAGDLDVLALRWGK